MNRTFALIPAAGKSTRMGRPKLLLPLDGRLVIERVIDSLREAGVRDILVVVAPHVPELMTLAEAAGGKALMLPAETPDMRATVEAGLVWLEEHFQPQSGDTWLLVPADHSVLDAEVLRQLLQTHADHPDCSIILPAYAGRRGHPALIDWKHVAGIRALPADQGLNVYLRRFPAETHEVLVDSPTVLLDLDTPEDYERLQEFWEKEQQEKNRDRFLLGLILETILFGPWWPGSEPPKSDPLQRRWQFWMSIAIPVWAIGLALLAGYLNVQDRVEQVIIFGYCTALLVLAVFGKRGLDRAMDWMKQLRCRGED